MSCNRYSVTFAVCVWLWSSLTAIAQELDGETLYKKSGCVGCHGTAGAQPVLPIYPVLAGQDAQYLRNQTSDILSGARKGGLTLSMRVTNQLSSNEIAAISDYLSGVDVHDHEQEEARAQSASFDKWNEAVITGGFAYVRDTPFDQNLAEGGDFRKGPVNKNELPASAIFYSDKSRVAAERVEQGKALYVAKACVGCHGVEGRDAPIPGYPSLAGQQSRYTMSQIRAVRDGIRNNGLAMVMQGVLDSSSDAELHMIADYLATVAR